MPSISSLVLHTSHDISLATYLSRVLGYLIVFAGLGIVAYWSLRAVTILQAAIPRHRRPPK